MYSFDIFGWYSGVVAEGSRTTNVAPTNTSVSTAVGELRSNWTGASWVELPYKISTLDVPKPIVPDAVTMRQARLALLGAGLYDSVNTALNAIPDVNLKTAALIEWEYALFVNRNSGLIQSLKPTLGLTDEQLDNLFIIAGNIPD